MTKAAYMRSIAEAVKLKSTCPQDAVGAVFSTQDHEVLATGYNGAPRGMPHCPKDCHGECQHAVHAEANAIVQAAKRGHALEGSVLWITRWPCRRCAMLIANLRVHSVVSWGKLNAEGILILDLARVDHYNLNEWGALGPLPLR